MFSAVMTVLAFGTPEAASAASSPGSGVHVDPGSPAGKQYVIPLPAARRETSGGQAGGSGSANPPLFGVGVTSASGAHSSGSSGTAARTGSRPTAKARIRSLSRPSRASKARVGSRPAATSGAQPSHRAAAIGSTSWLPLLGGGVLVLLIGGGGGLLLRRSR
jgi:hypothetical protein